MKYTIYDIRYFRGICSVFLCFLCAMSDTTDIHQLPSMHGNGSGMQQPVQPVAYNPNTPDVQNGPIQQTGQSAQSTGQGGMPPFQQPQQPPQEPVQPQSYNPNVSSIPPPQQQQQPQHPQQYPQGPPPQGQQPTYTPQPMQNTQHTQQQTSSVPSSEPLSQEVIQQLMHDVNSASSTGATRLPSRDIPRDTTATTMDEHQQPNYVPGHGFNAPPSVHNQDYIEQHDTMESMLAERNQRTAKEDRLNQLYEDIQTPVLVVVLFFIFQLPFVNKTFQKYLPNLWVEGKPSLGAFLIQASAFGVTYYGIRHVIQVLGESM